MFSSDVFELLKPDIDSRIATAISNIKIPTGSSGSGLDAFAVQAVVDSSIAVHTADQNAHHAKQHALVGSDHTASGLGVGDTIVATGTTTFAWQKLGHSQLSGLTNDDHTQYVHNTVARTITAQHSFSPGSAAAPFVLGANAQGQLVTGLRADQLNKSVTAGNGLTGGGTLTASITITLGTPSDLTVSTTNGVTATSHTHFISSSSNPGVASSLLKTDAAGDLILQHLSLDGTGVIIATNNVDLEAEFGRAIVGDVGHANYAGFAARNYATAAGYALLQNNTSGYTYVNTASGGHIYMRVANVSYVDMDSTAFRLTGGLDVQADNYASQTTGWRITYEGAGDFRYLFADELHVKVFIADLEQALAGGQIICKSVTILYSTFTAPAAAATATLTVRDLPSATGVACFQNGDMIRIRKFSRTAGSLSATDCWGTVVLDTTYGTSGFDSATKTQRYTFTRSSGTIGGANPPGGMAAGTTVDPDTIILDYGTSGNGFYEVSATDGSYAANAPYAQIATWTTHPVTGTTVRGRYGNLNGIFGTPNEFGIAVGDGFTTSNKYVRFSSTTAEMNNISSTWRVSGTPVITVDTTYGISLQTFDASGGGVITSSDIRKIKWGTTVPASSTPDSQIYGLRTSTLNELHIGSNVTGSRSGYVRIEAFGEAATGNAYDDVYFVIQGAQAASTRSYALLQADDFTIDLGDGSANIGNLVIHAAQIQVSDGSTSSTGSSTVPSITNFYDTDTGISWPGANQLNFVVGGTNQLGITTTSVSLGLPTNILQSSTTATLPTLALTQSDLSEEFIRFNTTVAAGNPANTTALGAYYGRVRVSVNGTFKWLALYD